MDLEFFDFENSSDEEIKEIQAILKGPGSNGCVELPWEILVKSNCKGSLSENEGTALEADLESTKSSKSVDETNEQTLSFVPPQALVPPVAQLQPSPTVEAFVSLPTTVGPYQNAPYFVSRSIPYLRGYPPMGVPFFACPMPGTGEANPYGQFVPMVPERPIHSEPIPKSRDRQSNRRSSKKRHSEGSENVNIYPDASTTCPTSVPLVPLPVPPSTFVGGNMPVHGYPPGLPSPAMYYVPVFNHPYGGYLPPSGPPMMLPVNVAPEFKCPPLGGEEMLLTDNGLVAFQANGGESPLTASSGGLCESPQTSSYGSLKESPRTANSGSSCESPQTASNSGPVELLETDQEVIPADSSCNDESLPTDNGSSLKVLQTLNSPIKEKKPNVQSDCKVSISSDTVNTQPVHPTANTDIPESEERIDSSDSLSGPLDEGSCSMNCFQKTEKCLEETISLAKAVTPKETAPAEAKESALSKVQLSEKLKILPTEDKDCQPATEKVKQVVRDPSRCWADLFKGPSIAVNGFETSPRQRHDKKSTLNNGKRDITNGKVYSVPPSNSLH